MWRKLEKLMDICREKVLNKEADKQSEAGSLPQSHYIIYRIKNVLNCSLSETLWQIVISAISARPVGQFPPEWKND